MKREVNKPLSEEGDRAVDMDGMNKKKDGVVGILRPVGMDGMNKDCIGRVYSLLPWMV